MYGFECLQSLSGPLGHKLGSGRDLCFDCALISCFGVSQCRAHDCHRVVDDLDYCQLTCLGACMSQEGALRALTNLLDCEVEECAEQAANAIANASYWSTESLRQMNRVQIECAM